MSVLAGKRAVRTGRALVTCPVAVGIEPRSISAWIKTGVLTTFAPYVTEPAWLRVNCP